MRRQPYCSRTPTTHHTPAYRWRGDRLMKPISVWGWLGGHDGQRPMGEFGQDAGLHSYSFSNNIPGFLMTTESQNLKFYPKDGAFYSIVSPSQHWGIRTHTDHKVRLTNTSSSSNLVFSGGLPSRYWPGSTLLSFSGQPVFGCRVIWLHIVHIASRECTACMWKKK